MRLAGPTRPTPFWVNDAAEVVLMLVSIYIKVILRYGANVHEVDTTGALYVVFEGSPPHVIRSWCSRAVSGWQVSARAVLFLRVERTAPQARKLVGRCER